MSGYGTFPAYSGIKLLPMKWPDSYRPYTVPVPTDEPIEAMELSVSPSGGNEMWPSFLLCDGREVRWWNAEGVPGRNYTVQIKYRTESNITDQVFYSVLCAPDLAKYPLPPEPCPGYGPPISWLKDHAMNQFGPVLNLQPLTVAATGSTQLTAAPVPVGLILVNAGTGGDAPGIILPKSFSGSILWITNVSGAPVTIYPYAGMTIAGLAANAGFVIQDQQTAHAYINESGFIVIS